MLVLIADDDRTTTAILSRTLERFHVETVVAHDGHRVLDAVPRLRHFAQQLLALFREAELARAAPEQPHAVNEIAKDCCDGAHCPRPSITRPKDVTTLPPRQRGIERFGLTVRPAGLPVAVREAVRAFRRADC